MTVVVPAHNAASHLPDALASIQAQTYLALECIVVDDGSTDSTPDVARGFPVRLIQQRNRGVAAARNAGVRSGAGEYVTFLDADDLWTPEKVKAQMEVVTETGAELVYCGLSTVDENGRRIEEHECAPLTDAVRNGLSMRPPHLSAGTMLLSRRAFDAVGGFDERLSTSADTDLACRVAVSCTVGRVDAPLVLYRQHGQQMHHNLDALERDMKLVHRKFFLERFSPEVAIRHREAKAGLQLTLAIGRWRSHQRLRAMGDALSALTSDPAWTLRVGGGLVSRWNAQRSGRSEAGTSRRRP